MRYTAAMTIQEALHDAARKLQPKKITCAADKSIGRLEAEILLAHALKKDRIWLLTHPSSRLPSPASRLFSTHVHRRVKHEPVAYILGEKEFYGRRFVVDKNVLIPRPETELMIELAKEMRPSVVWDVGTGSGAIAVTLACELPRAKILATDISSRSLDVAKRNAICLGVSPHITRLKSDLLQPSAYRWLKRHAKKDSLLICANLPYLPSSDAKKIDPDVATFEPPRALYSGKDGLDLITRFLGQLTRHIPDWAYQTVTILLEFDPPQTKKLLKLSKSLFPDATIKILKDLAGRDRVLALTLSRSSRRAS